MFAAGHEEAASLFFDVEGNGVEEVVGDFESGDIVKDDGFGSGELSDAEFAGVADDFEGVTLIGEDFFEGVGIVFGDKEDTGTAGDLNPALGVIVTGVGICDDGLSVGGNDFGAVLVGAGFGETVGEFGFGYTIDEGDGGFGEEGVVAIDLEGKFFVFGSSYGDAEDEGFAGLSARRSGETGDGVVVGGFVANESEVEGDALGFEFSSGRGEGFGGEAIGENEDAGGTVFFGEGESVLDCESGAGEFARTGVEGAIVLFLFDDFGSVVDVMEPVFTTRFGVFEEFGPLGQAFVNEVFGGVGTV